MAYQLGNGSSSFYKVKLLIPSYKVKAVNVTNICLFHIRIFFFWI